MPTTVTVTAYTFDELSDKAKDKARERMRSCLDGDELAQGTVEDADQVGIEITGWDIGRAQQCDLAFREDADETAALILANHGEECDTHKAATAYRAAIANLASKYTEETEDHDENMAADKIRAAFMVELEGCYLRMLTSEHEDRLSDEAIDEDIRANDYLFTEEGKRSVAL
jgi:hypothetical protein